MTHDTMQPLSPLERWTDQVVYDLAAIADELDDISNQLEPISPEHVRSKESLIKTAKRLRAYRDSYKDNDEFKGYYA